MKLLITSLMTSILLLFIACGEPSPSEADLAAEAEAERIEALNEDVSTSVEKIESTADELVDALDSLDLLFPEEN